ncbi:MAG: hypothetical protein IKE95_02330 [Methanobrevibacter sp.]|nr:hypothetical protein [Methanobrevibacter sp.]
MMSWKKVIILLVVLLLVLPVAFAEEGFDVSVGGNPLMDANFDNCTKIKEETIGPGGFTTLHNYTFHWNQATKITYKNSEGKIGHIITWRCNMGDEYYVLSSFHDLNSFYSDYTNDNKSVVYMESPDGEYVYGILLDTQNITWTEEDLVHDILGFTSLELTNSGYHYNPPIDVQDASHHTTHHYGSKSDQWDMAINDPDWYYDHYDYGDDGDIDDYLDEYYYW